MFGWYSTYSFFVQNFQNLLIHEDCHGFGVVYWKGFEKKKTGFCSLGLPWTTFKANGSFFNFSRFFRKCWNCPAGGKLSRFSRVINSGVRVSNLRWGFSRKYFLTSESYPTKQESSPAAPLPYWFWGRGLVRKGRWSFFDAVWWWLLVLFCNSVKIDFNFCFGEIIFASFISNCSPNK